MHSTVHYGEEQLHSYVNSPAGDGAHFTTWFTLWKLVYNNVVWWENTKKWIRPMWQLGRRQKISR